MTAKQTVYHLYPIPKVPFDGRASRLYKRAGTDGHGLDRRGWNRRSRYHNAICIFHRTRESAEKAHEPPSLRKPDRRRQPLLHRARAGRRRGRLL